MAFYDGDEKHPSMSIAIFPIVVSTAGINFIWIHERKAAVTFENSEGTRTRHPSSATTTQEWQRIGTKVTQLCLSSTNRPTEIRIGGMSYLYWHVSSPLKSSERVWSLVKEADAHLLFDVHFFQHLRNKNRHFKRNSSPKKLIWHHLITFMSFRSCIAFYLSWNTKGNSRVNYPFRWGTNTSC